MFVFLSFVIVCLCMAQFFVAAKSNRFWLLSPSTMMSAYFLLVSFPGIFLASSYDVVLQALLAHIIWFAGVLLAVLCVGGRLINWSEMDASKRPVFGNKNVFWFFVFLSVPAVMFTFYMLGRVPLFIGLGSLFGADNGISMHVARQMNTLEHRSGDTVYFGQGYLRQIYTVVSPIFLTALYILEKRNKKNENNPVVSIMMVFFVVAASLNGQIWVSAHVILLFFMAKYYVAIAQGRGGNEISLIMRGISAYLLLVGFVFAYRYFQSLQGREFNDFFFDTIRRIYSAGGVDLFGIFPETEAFRYGATWLSDLRGMLPGSIQSFAYEVHYLVHGGGWGFTLSPGIVASSYVNFGFVGVFIVGFFFTLVFNKLFGYLVRSGSAIKLAIAIYLSHRFTLAMPGDIANYVVCLITAPLMYAAYVFCNSLVRQFFSPNLRSA